MTIIFIIFAFVAAWLLYRAKKLGYFDKAKDKPSAPTLALFFPCVIEGTIDAPPMADRVNALAIEAASKGLALTGDYATDVAAQGGEMMLIGTSFKFVIDAAGKVVESESHLNLFLVNYPVDGGIDGNGNLGMAVNVGGAKVGIKGRIVGDKLVDAEVRKGWLPHIYGVLNGTWRAV